MNWIKALAAAAIISAAASAAHANSFQVEGSGARSYGQWGAEIGAGYRWQFGMLDLTPLAGGFIANDDSRAFARLEAGLSIPLVARFAIGARYIGSEVKPYGSVGMPIFPKLTLKANGGPHYAALGLSVGF